MPCGLSIKETAFHAKCSLFFTYKKEINAWRLLAGDGRFFNRYPIKSRDMVARMRFRICRPRFP